jgi:phosphoribosyl 1,2-cyclic phosphodiesterase
MKLKVLGSSSKGNCYILESPTGSLLIEAGLPFREIQKGLDFDLGNVVGALVTHEHKDHSKAVEDIMKAGIDVYTSHGTALKSGIWDGETSPMKFHRVHMMKSLDKFQLKDFIICPFDTEHDALEPFGYFVHYKPTHEALLFLTDSYYSKYTFKGLNYIMIECNYIKETLDANIAAGLIDERMKPRLLQSHFSLEHVKQFLRANDLSQVRELILLHLSSHNSDAARMIKEIKEVTGITPKIAEPGLGVELDLYPY